MNTENLKRLRVRAGLSIAGLADKAQINQGNLSRIERGQRGCGTETLRSIATALASVLGEDVATVLDELTAPAVAA